MTWQETNSYNEKRRFIEDWMQREYNFKRLYQRYNISRKTGYKLVNRFMEEGGDAFKEKSRSRHIHPNATSDEVIQVLLRLKHRYPEWGPKKIGIYLQKEEPQSRWPAHSTIGEILKRHGLVKSRKRRRQVPAHTQPLKHALSPNDVWSADFKGQFKLGDGKYCYPLTMTDNYSRFILTCGALPRPTYDGVKPLFEKAFREYGLPKAIRTDNGQPFAGCAIGGLTRLSIWWLKLGIRPERIDRGRPDQNGRHERMHRTLKQHTAKPPMMTMQKQQAHFDRFLQEFNYERPHEALDGKCPNAVYKKSNSSFPEKFPELEYPDHFQIRKVRSKGTIKWLGKEYFLNELLRGEPIGLEQIDELRALVHFASAQLGIIDRKLDRIIRP